MTESCSDDQLIYYRKSNERRTIILGENRSMSGNKLIGGGANSTSAVLVGFLH